ncbi:hypothetical protein ACX6XY_18690 [Streptomyces sp. O3]
MAGLVMLLFGLGKLGSEASEAVARERAFLAAAPCDRSLWDVLGVGAGSGERRDCLWVDAFTVDSAGTEPSGKSTRYYAKLVDSTGWGQRVTFSDRDPVFDRLSEGGRVEGTVWRGDVVRVSVDGVADATKANPVGKPLGVMMWGGFLVLGGALALIAGGWGLARPESFVPNAPRSAVVAAWVTGALAVDWALVGFIQLVTEMDVWLMGPFALVGAALLGAGYWCWRWARGREDRPRSPGV